MFPILPKKNLASWMALAIFALILSLARAPSVKAQTPVPSCEDWTPWLNRDGPGGKGDFETLAAFQQSGQACKHPRAIECQSRGGRPWTATGQKYTCDLDRGGICVNAEQAGRRSCLDYKVRFCCPADDPREQLENARRLLDAAESGEDISPFDPKAIRRGYHFWGSRVGPGDFSEYAAAIFDFVPARPQWQAKECDHCVVRDRWTYVGPEDLEKQNQGVVYAIWVSPRNSKHILVGSASGLWETKDLGESWRNLTDNARRLRLVGVLDIAVNPRNPRHILIGSGIAVSFSHLDRGYGFGVFMTLDGGLTWGRVPLTTEEELRSRRFPASRRVLFHPTNPRTVFASLGHEVYRSQNGGRNWSKVFETPSPKLPVTDLAVRSPGSGKSDELFVATYGGIERQIEKDPSKCVADPGFFVFAKNVDEYCEIINQARIFRVMLAGGFPVEDLSKTISDYEPTTRLTAVEVTPNGVIFAAHSGVGSESGVGQVVFYSEKGASWEKHIANLRGGRLNYSFALAFQVSPDDPRVVYLTGVNLMKSIDGGRTFSTMGQYQTGPGGKWPGSHVDVRSLMLAGTGPNVLYFGNDGGVSRTVDGLASTENLNGAGLQLAEVHGVGILEDRPGLVAFGTQHNGLFSNRHRSWATRADRDYYDTAVFRDEQGRVTAMSTVNGSDRESLIRSFEDADTTASTSARCPGAPCTYAELVVSGAHVYLASERLWRRPLGGGSWQEIRKRDGGKLCGGSASGLAPSRDGNVLYVTCAQPTWRDGPFEGKVYRVESPASSRPRVTDVGRELAAVQWRSLTDIATNRDGSIAYVSLGGHNENLFRYDHSKRQWARLTKGLPEVSIHAILYDEAGGTIYAGTDVGVYIRTPHGKRWLPFSRSAPLTLVTDLEIDRHRRKLVASTYGRGIWETSLPSGRELQNYCRPPVVDRPEDGDQNTGDQQIE